MLLRNLKLLRNSLLYLQDKLLMIFFLVKWKYYRCLVLEGRKGGLTLSLLKKEI